MLQRNIQLGIWSRSPQQSQTHPIFRETMLTVEQIVSTHRTRAAAFYELANQAVTGVERLAEASTSKTIKAPWPMAPPDRGPVRHRMSRPGGAAEPRPQGCRREASAYGRELYEIASGFGEEFAKVTEHVPPKLPQAAHGPDRDAVKNAQGHRAGCCRHPERRCRHRRHRLSSRCRRPSSRPPSRPSPASTA